MKTYGEAKKGAFIRARQLRRDSTDAEKRLWLALRSRLPDYKWRRQMPVGPYFADFACFAERLIIELDGGQHASSVDHDEQRQRCIEAEGYRVLRFWNHDVLNNTDGVLEMVAQSLSLGRGKEQRELREGEEIQTLVLSSPSQPPAGPLPLPAGEV